MKIAKYYVIIFILLSVVSCSSLKKDAEYLLENKRYREARALLLEAIPKDDDPELLVLKKEADDGLLKELLISMRNRNVEHRYSEAMNIAHQIRKIRSEGDAHENIHGSLLEKKEVTRTYPYFSSQMNLLFKEKHPLKAKKYLLDHGVLYENIYGLRISQLRLKIESVGKEKCEQLYQKSKADSLYYKQFINSYCSLFKSDKLHRLPKADPQLFSKIVVTGKIKKGPISDRAMDEIKANIRSSFKESVWYSSHSPNTAYVNLDGEFTFKEEKTEKIKVHEYSVQIPYTGYETVTKTRQESYLDFVYQCSPKDTTSSYPCNQNSSGDPKCSCIGSQITRFRDVNYNEQVPVTKYREEIRTYNYPSQNINFKGLISLKGRLRIGRFSVPIHFYDDTSENWFYSKVSRPKIGLHSQNPKPNFSNEWIQSRVGSISTKVKVASNEQWNKNFCKIKLTLGNYMQHSSEVFSCIKLKGKRDPLIKQWISYFSGMSENEFYSQLHI